jgi:hypothetical protein
LANGDFSIPIIPSLINWNSTIKKGQSFSLIYVTNYFYKYGFMDICFILWDIYFIPLHHLFLAHVVPSVALGDPSG